MKINMRKNSFEDIYRSKNYNNIYKTTEFPYIIDIELTNDCNLNCKFCSRRIMKRDIGYMTDNLFKSIMKQCKNRTVGIRFIRWGEPFLHPNILDFCKLVKEENHPLHITTNGLLLNEKIIDELVKLELDSIVFSFQGTTKEDYKNLRNNDEYDTLEKNILMLVKSRGERDKPFIHITCTIDDANKKDSNIFKEKWCKIVDEVSIGKTNWSRLREKNDVIYIQCKEPWQKLGIDWDGEVSACCGDYDKLMNIGYFNNNISELWNNDIITSYRKLIVNNRQPSLSLCRKCTPAYGDVWTI